MIEHEALQRLDWGLLMTHLVSCCQSQLGRMRALQHDFAKDSDECQLRYLFLEEYEQAYSHQEHLSFQNIKEIPEILSRAEEKILDKTDIVAVADFLSWIKRAIEWSQAYKSKYPNWQMDGNEISDDFESDVAIETAN